MINKIIRISGGAIALIGAILSLFLSSLAGFGILNYKFLTSFTGTFWPPLGVIVICSLLGIALTVVRKRKMAKVGLIVIGVFLIIFSLYESFETAQFVNSYYARENIQDIHVQSSIAESQAIQRTFNYGLYLVVIGGALLVLTGADNINEKKEKYNRYIFFALVLLVIGSSTIFILLNSLEDDGTSKIPNYDTGVVARDSKRMVDMTVLKNGMEIYFRVRQGYPASSSLFEVIEAINDKNITGDPGNSSCDGYQWISNRNNPQKYCAWACLEQGGYYAVSHKGAQKLTYQPSDLECWEN